MGTPMALRVAALIVDAGGGDINTIRAHFRHYSRRDLTKALQAANALGHIRVGRKGKGDNCPTWWLPGYVPLVKPPKVASVFELGAPRPETAWPVGWMGTVHRPLGTWTEQEELAA